MFSGTILLIFLVMFLTIIGVDAQFGINKNDDVSNDNTNMGIDDPELAEAIQMFADMSPEEMMETMKELRYMFENDPETMKEVEEIMQEIAKLDPAEMKQSLTGSIDEEMAAKAMDDTMDMLKNADESDWNKIRENKEQILEVVIQSGVMDVEEVRLFRTDPDAWEEELKIIWKELKMQADGENSRVLGEL
jgi:hypothetical protein